MNLRYGLPFWVFLLLIEFPQAKSTFPSMDDNESCDIFFDERQEEEEENLCSSYCFKSVKPPLAYIIELKDQIKVNEQRHMERKHEISQLRKKLSDIDNIRGQDAVQKQLIAELRKVIENLRKTMEDFLQTHRETIPQQNNIARNEELKAEIEKGKLKQDSLNKEIQILKSNDLNNKQQVKEMQNNHEEVLKILEREKEKWIIQFKSKENDYENLKKTHEKDLKTLRENLAKEKALKELSSKGKELLKLNQTERNLNKCEERLLKTSCKSLSSGIYSIKLPGLVPFCALCNAEIERGGWIVIQNRFDGSEDFKRNWSDFVHGFGKLDGEFFIGLEQLYRITNSERYEMRIQMQKFNGTVQFSSFNNFRIGNESEEYVLKSFGAFTGTVENNYWHYGLKGKFLTFDHDNEQHCALEYGAWWYNESCNGPNLNGLYYKSAVYEYNSMSWDGAHSLKAVQMLIRPESQV